jgi:DHA1 family bicyclomycin/chloramphenicol resistance-like MFS transporter
VIVRDVYGDARATSVLGYVTAAMALAPLIGPIAGGYLIDYFGWRSVFVAVGVLATALLVLLGLGLPETKPPEQRGRTRRLIPTDDYAALLRRFAYLRYVWYGAMMQGTFMAFIAGAPYVARSFFGLSASAYGWHFMVVPIGFFTGSMIAGRFATRWDRDRLLGVGAWLAVLISAFAFWLSFQPDFSAWRFFLPMALLSCAIGAVLPSAQVGLLASAGEHSGTASGLFSFLQLLLGAALAQLVGVLLVLGPSAVTGVMTVVSASALLATLVGGRRAPRPATDTPG